LNGGSRERSTRKPGAGAADRLAFQSLALTVADEPRSSLGVEGPNGPLRVDFGVFGDTPSRPSISPNRLSALSMISLASPCRSTVDHLHRRGRSLSAATCDGTAWSETRGPGEGGSCSYHVIGIHLADTPCKPRQFSQQSMWRNPNPSGTSRPGSIRCKPLLAGRLQSSAGFGLKSRLNRKLTLLSLVSLTAADNLMLSRCFASLQAFHLLKSALMGPPLLNQEGS